MKNVFKLLLLLSFGLLASCSGEDGDESSPISIEGKWYEISSTLNGEVTPALHADGCEYNYSFFTSNSLTSYYFDNITGECIEHKGNENVFSIEEDIITLSNSGRQYEIVQLDNETLILFSNRQVDFNQDGENDELYVQFSRSPTGNNNPNVSTLLGKWILYKAIYEGESQPTMYDINGDCGKEVLEFFANKEAFEMIYIDSNCNNGVGTGWDWWSSGSVFKMGFENSDSVWTVSINGNELLLDGWQDWGYKKYYKKAE
ncbi:lipocalin family protein [Flavobacterium sp. PLA-1-15]|uniref:lipocalin family protein n=1 Tax=Flavobacterium sp. PLA-1-15 TaxID=3380533 RepID=UPI003B7A9E2A